MHRNNTPIMLFSSLMTAAWLAAAVAAQDTQPTTRPATHPPTMRTVTYAESIERAHSITAWNNKKALKTEISIEFGGNRMINGVMYYDIHGNRVRIEQKDGPTMVFDGARAWVSPADAEQPMARFHLLTWPYFLAAPFKLQDPGSHLEDMGRMKINDTNYDAARLTFDPGVGDAPDDWYIVYKDVGTDLLYAMAYIVTYGTPVTEAEKEPHAISYGSYSYIDGVWLPLAWQFWNWSEEEDIHGEPLGKGFLRNLEFIEVDDALFTRPDDAREDKLPGALAPGKASE